MLNPVELVESISVRLARSERLRALAFPLLFRFPVLAGIAERVIVGLKGEQASHQRPPAAPYVSIDVSPLTERAQGVLARLRRRARAEGEP